MDILKTLSSFAPTIVSIIKDQAGGNLGLLFKMLGVSSEKDAEEKIKDSSIEEINHLEKKLQFELEKQKIELNEKTIEHENNKLFLKDRLASISDRNSARKIFAGNNAVLFFGMAMSSVGLFSIIFFSYKSLFINDENLHFVREVKAFIEGSLVSIVMQYFFGNAHRG